MKINNWIKQFVHISCKDGNKIHLNLVIYSWVQLNYVQCLDMTYTLKWLIQQILSEFPELKALLLVKAWIKIRLIRGRWISHLCIIALSFWLDYEIKDEIKDSIHNPMSEKNLKKKVFKFKKCKASIKNTWVFKTLWRQLWCDFQVWFLNESEFFFMIIFASWKELILSFHFVNAMNWSVKYSGISPWHNSQNCYFWKD